MPIVSVFFGITIRMYFGDHPPPHIHAAYQGQAALISIETGKVLRGSLRSRAAIGAGVDHDTSLAYSRELGAL